MLTILVNQVWKVQWPSGGVSKDLWFEPCYDTMLYY